MDERKCEGNDHGWNDTEVREYNYWAVDGQSFKPIHLCRRCEEDCLKLGDDVRTVMSFRCPECLGSKFGTEGGMEGYQRFCLGQKKGSPNRIDEASEDPCGFRWNAEDDERYGLGEYVQPMNFDGFEDEPQCDSIPAPAL